MVELTLARNFPPADEAAWKALVAEALKDAPFASLRSESYDGIVIEPLYPRAQGAERIASRAAAPWSVMQRIDLPRAKAANMQIRDDLSNGANGITLVFEGAVGDYGCALPATEEAVATILDGVHLDAGIAVELDFGPPSRQVATLMADYVRAKGLKPSTLDMRFCFDPLGARAVRGAFPMPWAKLAPVVTGLIGDLMAEGFSGPFAVADGRPVHAAGGTEAQELGFVLANALAYLRALEAQGLDLDQARRAIFFRLAADQDQFLTMAKFRSLRKLWARIEEACGLTPRPALVCAETAWRMMAKRDPHGNIVRGTIAALAAAVGGADAITVLPFSAALGVPDGFARRIARNMQTILIEESNLHRVADPAAGSGAIEALTDALCQAAWWFFQRIERAGGAAAALEAGLIQRVVARVRAERETNVARRKVAIVGTSDFPYLHEGKVEVFAESRPARAAPVASALPRIRLAEPFEHLRDRSDTYLAKHGTRPKVFLACLGRPADFNARASFAKSLFEAGGIEAMEGSDDNLRERFMESGAPLACLCSSDKVYAREAADAAKTLTAAGAKHIYLAGKPRADRAALEGAGIRTFLHQGCDTLSILNAAYDEIDRR
ncbi:MAG: methylmalonyl-CoA mutase family protein [Methyloceanibacter sp.]